MASSGTHFFNVWEYGTATIPANSSSIQITFEEVHNYRPIVSIMTSQASGQFNTYVTNVTSKSAVINLSATCETNVTLYYQVISMT